MAGDLDRVLRNVRRMMIANAPDADLDAYLQGEGVTREQLQSVATAPPHETARLPEYKEMQSPWADVNAAGRSVARQFPIAGPLADLGLTDQQRQEDADFARRNPVANTVATGAGIVGSAGGLAKRFPAAFGAAPGQSLPARVLSGLTSGSLIGGADAALRSPQNPWEAAKEGAMWGGGLGAAFPIVAPVIGRSVGEVAKMLPKGRAGAAFRAAAKRSRFNPTEFSMRPPEAMVMDAGEDFQKLGKSVAASGGTGREIMENAATRRATEEAAMRGRLRDEAKQVFDPMLASAVPARTGRSLGERATQEIDRLLTNVVNDDGQRRWLASLRNQIQRAGNDPSRIHDIQSTLGEYIRDFSKGNSTSRRFSGRLWAVRQGLTTMLDQSIAAGGQFSRGSYLQAQREYADALERIMAAGTESPASQAIKQGVTESATKEGGLAAHIRRVGGLSLEVGVPAYTAAHFGLKPAAAAAGGMLARRAVQGVGAAMDARKNAHLARYLSAGPGYPLPLLPGANQAQIDLAVQRLLSGANIGVTPKLAAK